MPDRIIRDQARRSPTLQAFSDAAERAWWRLSVACDDQGRFEADPALLLAELFKRKPSGWTSAKMQRVVDEWAEAGAVHLYRLPGESRTYGHIPSFLIHQRKRDSRPRHPDPPCEKAGKGKLSTVSTACTDSMRSSGQTTEPHANRRMRPSAASRGETRQLASVSDSDSESRETISDSDARAANMSAAEATGPEPGHMGDQDAGSEAHRQCRTCGHEWLGGPRCPKAWEHGTGSRALKPTRPPPAVAIGAVVGEVVGALQTSAESGVPGAAR